MVEMYPIVYKLHVDTVTLVATRCLDKRVLDVDRTWQPLNFDISLPRWIFNERRWLDYFHSSFASKPCCKRKLKKNLRFKYLKATKFVKKCYQNPLGYIYIYIYSREERSGSIGKRINQKRSFNGETCETHTSMFNMGR